MNSRRETRSDVVIIGSGLVGMFTALHLLDTGVRDVTVIDKGPAGGSASPRAAGLLRRHYHIPLLVEMAKYGDQAYSAFDALYGVDIGFQRRGFVVALAPEHHENLKANTSMQQELGVDVELIAGSQLGRLFPEFKDIGSDVSVAYEKDCAFVDPQKTCAALLGILRDKGARVIENDAVVGIETSQGAVSAVVSKDHYLRTDHAVNCAGAWSFMIGTLVGEPLPIEVHRLLQIVEVEQLSGTHLMRILDLGSLDLYARPNTPTTILIGGRIPFTAPTRADAVRLAPDKEKSLVLRESFQSVSAARLGAVKRSWAGIDGDTPDYQPIIERSNRVDGLWTAAGFSGHGFKLAPAAGRAIAEGITGRAPSLPVLGSFSLDRFSAGNLYPRGYKQMGS